MPKLLRVHDARLQQWFIVQDGTVYADLDGDGRISHRDGCGADSHPTVARAAKFFDDYFEVPVPGTPSPEAGVSSAGTLNTREAAAFAAGPPGVAARRSDLLGHLDFFDRRSGDGFIGLGENYLGWRDLGFGRAKSLMQALGSALVFGRILQGLAIDIERIAERRPKAPSGIYGADGNVNRARLEEMAAMFDGQPVMTHAAFRAALASRAHLGTVPARQFESLCALSAKSNGAATVTRTQFLGLFDNSLFWAAVSMPRGSSGRRL